MFSDFFPFFVVIASGLLFSELFKRLHLPLVVALILAGFVIGPEGLGWVQQTPILEFLGRIGIIFLMFIAGLEVRAASFWSNRASIAPLFIFNSLIPFLGGLAIALYFNYSGPAAILLGAIFLSSSGAVIIPILEAKGLMHKKLGQTIVAGTILEDVTALVILSLLLQVITPVKDIPFLVFYGLVVLIIFSIKFLIPILKKFFRHHTRDGESILFEEELRIVFTVLIGVVILFELVGLHDIIASFFTGLLLSGVITTRTMKEKISAIGYSFFIPIFFVLVGTKLSLDFIYGGGNLTLILAVVAGSIFLKFISGSLGALAGGFSKRESKVIGLATTAQIFTALAISFTALELGVFDQNLATAVIILSIVSTLFSSLLVDWLKVEGEVKVS